MTILITGACGNLGVKLVENLAGGQDTGSVIALDLQDEFPFSEGLD